MESKILSGRYGQALTTAILFVLALSCTGPTQAQDQVKPHRITRIAPNGHSYIVCDTEETGGSPRPTYSPSPESAPSKGCAVATSWTVDL